MLRDRLQGNGSRQPRQGFNNDNSVERMLKRSDTIFTIKFYFNEVLYINTKIENNGWVFNRR
jgi:hypothetical protein